MNLNVHAAWIGMLLGCLGGAFVGLFFHREDFLGGYDSWRRRLTRLGHISFFGLGLINLGFASTTRFLDVADGISLASNLLVVGAVTMPLVCYLSAWRIAFRHLFFIPASSVTVGIAALRWRII